MPFFFAYYPINISEFPSSYLPVTEGKIDFGTSYWPAKPALIIPDPLSITIIGLKLKSQLKSRAFIMIDSSVARLSLA